MLVNFNKDNFTRNIAIVVENLHYKYISSKKMNQSEVLFKEVLRGISFQIYEKEKVSIFGPNGAGKSTLLLNIAGLLEDKYRSRKIYIYGNELNGKNIYDIREKIGFVFQDPNDQLFSTTVFDDVAFGLINYLKKRKDQKAKDVNFISQEVKKALAKVNLLKDGIEDQMPYFLSFGEKKLASLATVLSYNPEIFLLDEPSSNLDPKNREDFIELLQKMDKTIVLATHDLDLAYEFSERSILINEGKVIADGPSKKILSDKNLLEQNNLRLPLSLRNK